MNHKPLIVQSDFSVLLETESEAFESARDALVLFAELIKSPDYIHTYKISPLSIWNAASNKMTSDDILAILKKYSKYQIPHIVIHEIEEQIKRFGAVKLVHDSSEYLKVTVAHRLIYEEIAANKRLHKFQLTKLSHEGNGGFLLPVAHRGDFKLQMIKLGYPVEDLAGYIQGSDYNFDLLEKDKATNQLFALRDYQRDAVESFYANGSEYGGSGVVVLPCGSGKTVVAIGTMSKLKQETLIVSTNITAIKQWKAELLNKTDIKEEDIGEYSGESKEIKPITIASYQIITYRKSKTAPFKHFSIFNERDWGLIIYDEVHLLPAPVFRVVSSIQSRRRLGLTATLVREDGLEEEVFSLIGPKKFELPWKQLESSGWIATSLCVEYRIDLQESLNVQYAMANKREKFRIASENPLKTKVIDAILEKHEGDHVLIIGQYLSQLNLLKERYDFPMITGKTPNKKREALYQAFKSGKIKQLIVSKVANFAVDLPDANVAIQLSGTFGSRQEEAQRLGRILRPKKGNNTAYFYSVITKNTIEEMYARNRQLFLIEQGYKYESIDYEI